MQTKCDECGCVSGIMPDGSRCLVPGCKGTYRSINPNDTAEAEAANEDRLVREREDKIDGMARSHYSARSRL